MDFSKAQFDYALLAANVYGAKSSVRTEMNTIQLLDERPQLAEVVSMAE
ncbi:hypothetical protein ACI6Q5_21720 [Xanthomonas codiaei]|uniref:Uncharacterized protein n=1 Tax=Xanthomonas codiaei TaxID=56463 RepID=A0ABW9MTC8_9XANT|nr:hypothetical protein [Xanthomonas codiaei]